MTDPATTDRTILRLTGEDVAKFLQGLVSNDFDKLSDGMVYAALLTPQGKYLADFFLVPDGDAILLDVQTDLAAGLAQRLNMYRLRSDVQIVPTDITVSRGTGTTPDGAFADPRHTALGWRSYMSHADMPTDWDAIRVEHMVPETGIELIPNESYILEMGFERLNGVDFRKGCYVGQEVTARMKHKTELRKGLARVSFDAPVPVGTPITSGTKAIGTIFTQSNGQALAYLRFDRATGEMNAGPATVSLLE